MKIKCWQGDCPEGKVGCCYECDRRNKCEDACDERCDAGKVENKMTKRMERLGDFVSILTAIIWGFGFWEIYHDSCSYPLMVAMFVSLSMWLKVIIPERDEEDDL